jgi:hypothetical protein
MVNYRSNSESLDYSNLIFLTFLSLKDSKPMIIEIINVSKGKSLSVLPTPCISGSQASAHIRTTRKAC